MEDKLYWKSQLDYRVGFIRGRISEFMRGPNDTVIIKGEDTMNLNRALAVPYDMVILANGMELGLGSKQVAKALGLELEDHGFIKPMDPDRMPVQSTKKGIFLAGALTGPKTISDSITEGTAAAIKAYEYATKGIWRNRTSTRRPWPRWYTINNFLQIDYVKDIYQAVLGRDSFNTVKGDPKAALSNILKAMELKSKEMRELQINTQDDAKKVFDSVFYARKYFNPIMERVGISKFSQAFSKLQDSTLTYDERVSAITSLSYPEAEEDLRDMARELIHFMEPENYPLWTRWIWNNERGTGSITYVLKEGLKLSNEQEFFSAVKELRDTLSIFGLDVPNYFGTSIFFSLRIRPICGLCDPPGRGQEGRGALPISSVHHSPGYGLKTIFKGDTSCQFQILKNL